MNILKQKCSFKHLSKYLCCFRALNIALLEPKSRFPSTSASRSRIDLETGLQRKLHNAILLKRNTAHPM